MSELGSGSGSGYPGAIDTDTTQEVNSPNAGRTKARAEVINDAYAAIVALQTELGTDPAGSLTDVKTWLQTEHGADGTHDATKIVEIAGAQTITGVKTFSAIVKTAKGADVASAGALTLLTDGNAFDITGTTSITSIGTLGVGTVVILEFDGALTFTHHATDLILPTGANITTAAGDIAIMYEYATGDWRCASYTKASGESVLGQAAPVAGDVLLVGHPSVIAEDVGTSYVKKFAFVCGRTGTYRIKFTMTRAGSATLNGQIYKNGVAHGTERTLAAGGPTTYSEDLAFTATDTCELWIKVATYSAGCTWDDYAMYADASLGVTNIAHL